MLNLAEEAAQIAWRQLETYLNDGSSFVFEAGAGAGKTHSLIESLKFLINSKGRVLQRNHQQIACITFTNAARDVITERTDGHPVIFCETLHAFAWNLISQFQKQLSSLIRTLEKWNVLLLEIEDISDFSIEYNLGKRAIEEKRLLLHHDDIFPLFVSMLNGEKFKTLLKSRFPIILIDEYQDTDDQLIIAFRHHFFGKSSSPQFGFYGDHWQKIYGDGCGSIHHDSLRRVEKRANFRSVKVIVDSLNRIRSELPQLVNEPTPVGMVQVWHTNSWGGRRQTKNHWQTDLPTEEAKTALSYVKDKLKEDYSWDFSVEKTKVLMLTHRALATELGYSSLPNIFNYNDSFSRKTNSHIAFFVDFLEPAINAFEARKFGKMFEALGRKAPPILGSNDKQVWSETMAKISLIRREGTVGDMMQHLLQSGRPDLPNDVERVEHELSEALSNQIEMGSLLREVNNLKGVPYKEISELARYLKGTSPFETKHGVKGAQFENTLVVFGRGWNEYNFNEYLECIDNPLLIKKNPDAFERNRNLFYVVCSRPKKRLALLFTHQLSQGAINTLSTFFGADNIKDIGSEL